MSYLDQDEANADAHDFAPDAFENEQSAANDQDKDVEVIFTDWAAF